MMRKLFEIDPTLVAEALKEGRKLFVEIDDARQKVRVTLGLPSPYAKGKHDIVKVIKQ